MCMARQVARARARVSGWLILTKVYQDVTVTVTVRLPIYRYTASFVVMICLYATEWGSPQTQCGCMRQVWAHETYPFICGPELG
jgi:hypothetical protein